MIRKSIIIMFLLLSPVISMYAQVELGGKMDNFTAIDQDGEKWTFKKELKNAEYMVVYFYPIAFTGGCTKQACTYRDHKGALAALNAQVVGVSGDEPETLELFALEHNLNFTLLSDPSGDLANLFGVPHGEGGSIQREINGRTVDLERGTTIQRWTFILDNEGILIYKDSEVNASEDSNKVIEFLSSL
jgi:peroxiredoxin Q/BCP